jgi:hypothetical protein
MPAYYFHMVGIPTGDKPDPATDKLISIQYQKIDLTTGEPLGELVIHREWKGSEKSIITTLYNQFFKPEISFTQFIPVGMGLDYEYEMLIAKCKKYDLPAPSTQDLYFRRPRFDLKSTIVLLNGGRFTGARLDTFSAKKLPGSHVKEWYEKKEFDRIDLYVKEEAASFLKLLQHLNRFKDRMGVTRKDSTAGQKAPQPVPGPGAKKGFISRKSVENPARITETGAPAKRRGPQRSLGVIAKAEPPSRERSRTGRKSPEPKTTKPLSQFRKHEPVKKESGKRK